MPPHNNPKIVSYSDRYPTPDGAPPTQFWVDSPLENKSAAPQKTHKVIDDASHPLNNPPPKSSKPKPSLPVREQPSKPASEKKQELRFFNVTDPKELKNRSQLRLNRQHVMHTFLEKERQKPSGQRDVRVDGAGAAMKRKRSRIQVPTTPFTVGLIGSGGIPGRKELPTPPESSCASDREAEHTNTPSKQKASEQKKVRQTDHTHANESQQLVKGLNGTWDNSRYNQANWEDIPFPTFATTDSPNPNTNLGTSLNPFNTWPTFSTSDININALKWSCSRRFGSEGIAQYWVPELLRARHAFLSTICISSAHDDIMMRASTPNPKPWHSTREGIERWRVRSEVIGLVTQSLEDPESRVADATIISVLHLLNSEVMGCDDRVMKTHQDGLHRMVRQRGGLEGLGVKGQLARILTITMYMISVLRESSPHGEFVAYASKHTHPTIQVEMNSKAKIPESPIYCRPSGFQTITSDNCASIETWDLINDLRDMTKHFFLLHSNRPIAPQVDHKTALQTLRNKLFTLPPSHDPRLHFHDLSGRNTYEALRLTALLYAHALTTSTPLSLASTHLTSGTATTSTGAWPPSISATESLHVQIRDALLKTDCSSVWGPLAGVLFWAVLVAGAGANPGPLAQEERVGADEDGRKFLAAVAVRCSIVLSFEFGSDVLEMLRRFVWVEGVLNGREGSDGVDGNTEETVSSETWSQGQWTSEPGMGTFIDGQETAGPEIPPVQQQPQDWAQMADFAWDFDGLG